MNNDYLIFKTKTKKIKLKNFIIQTDQSGHSLFGLSLNIVYHVNKKKKTLTIQQQKKRSSSNDRTNERTNKRKSNDEKTKEKKGGIIRHLSAVMVTTWKSF